MTRRTPLIVILWWLLASLLLSECVRLLRATVREARAQRRAQALALKAHRNGIGVPDRYADEPRIHEGYRDEVRPVGGYQFLAGALRHAFAAPAPGGISVDVDESAVARNAWAMGEAIAAAKREPRGFRGGFDARP